METLNTDVAIVGGGPSGLMLAIELGCRGIPCMLLEEDAAPPRFPKANATSARTMEHYRRRGFAHRVRASGLPADRPQDIVYCTRGAGLEIARFRIPAPARAQSGADFGDYGAAAWPTPELPHRGQQMFIEPILMDEARRYPGVDLRLGAHVDALQEEADGVRVEATINGVPARVRARYVVGCDGSRSVVREAMGVGYQGRGREEREFFGGQMLTIYFRSAELADALALDPAWTYWVVNPQLRGVLIAIDGWQTYAAGIQLEPGRTAADIDTAATIAALVGRPVAHELIDTGTWLAGYMLVAERLRAGRRFIAGDAAHLFTPAAGMGYNTSIDDAVNLGWKLAAVLRGWGGEALLDSYEAERRPIALRNTAYARQMADSMGSLSSPRALEDESPAGAAARREFGARCLAHIRREFNTPGLQLGLRYASAVIAREDAAPPPDDPTRYEPSGYPGVRAPHLAEPSGGSLYDRCGPEFTLLCLGPDAAAPAWLEAAARLGVPLAHVPRGDAAARRLYGAERVLVRPDGHIAWRGDAVTPPQPVLDLALGRT